jgi:hypothetical protein
MPGWIPPPADKGWLGRGSSHKPDVVFQYWQEVVQYFILRLFGDMFDAVTCHPQVGELYAWDGSFSSIAPCDLSTFILMHRASHPQTNQVFTWKASERTLLPLRIMQAGGDCFLGSPQFAFLASSLDDGTSE